MYVAQETSTIDQIGTTAGVVWQFLNENGPTQMSALVKQIESPRDQVMQAIGWLARENKIAITTRARSRIIELIG